MDTDEVTTIIIGAASVVWFVAQCYVVLHFAIKYW